MGGVLALCRQPDHDDDDDDDDDRRPVREPGETWISRSTEVEMQWAIDSPWRCSRCGAVWDRVN